MEETWELAALAMTINPMTYLGVAAFCLSALGATLGVYAFKNRAIFELSYFVESFAVEDEMLRRFGYAFYDMGNDVVEDRSLQFVKVSFKNTGNQIITGDLIREPIRYYDQGLAVEYMKSITNLFTLSADGTYKNERGEIPVRLKTYRKQDKVTKRMRSPKEAMAKEEFFTVTVADTVAIAELDFDHLDPGDVVEIEIIMSSAHISDWGVTGKISKVNLKSLGSKTLLYSSVSGFEDPFKIGHPKEKILVTLPPVDFDNEHKNDQ